MRIGFPQVSPIVFRASTAQPARVPGRDTDDVLYARRREGAYALYPVQPEGAMRDRIAMTSLNPKLLQGRAPVYVALPVTPNGTHDFQRPAILLNLGTEGALHQLPQNNTPNLQPVIKRLLANEKAYPHYTVHPADQPVRDAFIFSGSETI